MAIKQIGIKEKEKNRKNAVLGMISSEVMETAAGHDEADNLNTDAGSETAEDAEQRLP